MNRLDELRAKRREIYAIAKRHKVKRLYVFGSCARGEDTPESDVDFLAEFSHDASLFNLFHFQNEMEGYLKCHVDTVPLDALEDSSFDHAVRKEMLPL